MITIMYISSGYDAVRKFIDFMKEGKICNFIKSLLLICGLSEWTFNNTPINEVTFELPSLSFFDKIINIATNCIDGCIGQFFNFLKVGFKLEENQIDEYRQLLLCMCYKHNIPYCDYKYSGNFYLNQLNNLDVIEKNLPYF